jgi:formylglycine-generating enzyme required for sulfatase activity
MHFFISYAKKDTRALALDLAEALEASPELTAWVDQELKATGSIWSRQIEREIQRCDYMIVLLSPDVNRSEDHPSGESFVLKEVEYMIQLKKERRIIVVMAQETLVPLMLTGKQYLDFHGETDAHALADRLCDELGITRASELRAAKAAQQAQAEAEAREREAQARRDAEARAEQERIERAQREAAAADARQREQQRRDEERAQKGAAEQVRRAARPPLRLRIPWRPVAIVVAVVAMIALAAWVLPQVLGNGRGVVPTPTLSATAPVGVPPPSSSTPTISATATRDPSLPSNAFLRQPNNAAWTPYARDFDGIEMVLVPIGCFRMGNDAEAWNAGAIGAPDGGEQCFDAPFWIGRYEVTNAQYGSSGAFAGDQRPREDITWLQARDFCAARGLRLPTESEWEYAARGPDALHFPWGDAWNENYAVWHGNSNSQTADVGSVPAGRSWVGADDMIGNVWEWTSSVFEDYPYDPNDGREQDSDDTSVRRALRGGSLGSADAGFLRAAARVRNDASDGNNNRGVRCARDI